jgi:hypothetical protein
MQLLRGLAMRSPLYRSPIYFRVAALYHWRSEKRIREQWEARGRTGPPPHAVKQAAVRSTARAHKLNTLVETGTCLGEMVFAMRQDFDKIYSIEVEPTLYANARARLRRFTHVEILQGDSAKLLPAIVAKLTAPALFWLDGHYSGEATGRGDSDTPIRAELATVLASPHRHVVLVDDAHCFTGKGDYPTLDELTQLAKQLRRDAEVTVTDNVIAIL